MEKGFQQMLPPNFPATFFYGYSGQTSKGKILSSPGPMIQAKQNVPIKVVWVN